MTRYWDRFSSTGEYLAYAALFGFEFPPGENAAHLFRYNPDVFIAPAWEQIYCTDDERTAPVFPGARVWQQRSSDI